MISQSDKEAVDRVMSQYFGAFPDKFGERLDTEHLASWIGENTNYECWGCGYTFAECICETFDPRI